MQLHLWQIGYLNPVEKFSFCAFIIQHNAEAILLLYFQYEVT